jgi:hypothetical protein
VSRGPNDWGIVSAAWLEPDTSPPPSDLTAFHLGHGLLADLGPATPTFEGARMLALSSGSARAPGQSGFTSPSPGLVKGWDSNFPFGLPYEATGCSSGVASGDPKDGIALDVQIRAPVNVNQASFVFSFFSAEWPNGICSAFDDVFAALVVRPQEAPISVAFDKHGSAISSNGVEFDACACADGPPCTAGGKTFACSLGSASLEGSGFGSEGGTVHASTGWQLAGFNVSPGETFTLRLLVYDGNDGGLDSTVLVDRFRWIHNPGTGHGLPE